MFYTPVVHGLFLSSKLPRNFVRYQVNFVLCLCRTS